MASTTETNEYVKLKLLVNEESNKVVFAEAGKEFVDILCSFLTMPLGTVARLMQKDSSMGPVSVGCLNSLYQTVKDLNKECLWKDSDKEMLLQPKNSSEDYCSTLKFNIDDSQPTKYFIRCLNSYCDYSSTLYLSTSMDDERCKCRSAKRSVVLKHFHEGFVNSDASFVITDDLKIMPNTMVYTSFSLLKNSGIVTSSTKEMTVIVTKEKVLDLLKCALVSKSPLTDMFLGNKPSIERSSFFSCEVENDLNADIQITVELVIRKSDGKILFAHGEQDFTDLLLSFLTFPLGGVVCKLGGCSSIGSIDGLYKSIVELDENQCLKSKEAKNRLVDPHLAKEYISSKQILPINQSRVNYYCYYQGQDSKQSIVDCKFFITNEYRRDEGKYVEMHLVKDNENTRNEDDLKKKVVTIGMKECLGILKAALTSTSALTNGLSHLLTEDMEEN
ncbi:DUF674 family protein [Medicago truncatula]|uniref:DUF674 family protein n=1 Tax=Medicago truncatula TaxID=3880 RepID=A0A072U1I6_MEDTR|nr:DUF674 family protein [Medicago truncatula]